MQEEANLQAALCSVAHVQIKVVLGSSFGTYLQFGTLSGTAWQNRLRQGGKSGAAFLAAHWVPLHWVFSYVSTHVATHYFIIRDNNISYSWPLECVLPFFT